MLRQRLCKTVLNLGKGSRFSSFRRETMMQVAAWPSDNFPRIDRCARTLSVLKPKQAGERLARGRAFWNNGTMIKREILQSFFDEHRLTQRQQEILLQIMENEPISSAEIASKLGCSVSAVNVHLSNIFAKVGCRSRAEVIKLVMKFASARGDGHVLAINPLIILSADDDKHVHEGIARSAEKQFGGKITFIPCSNGQEVMMHLSRSKNNDPEFPRPHIILLDLQMPGMDGYETLRRIKSDIALKDIPVIVFSGTIRKEDTKDIYALGANSLVIKPSSPETLDKFVQVILQYWGL